MDFKHITTVIYILCLRFGKLLSSLMLVSPVSVRQHYALELLCHLEAHCALELLCHLKV